MSVKKSDISKDLDETALKEKLVGCKKELLNLRFQLASGELSNTARFKQVRKEVARISTFLTQKKHGGNNA